MKYSQGKHSHLWQGSGDNKKCQLCGAKMEKYVPQAHVLHVGRNENGKRFSVMHKIA